MIDDGVVMLLRLLPPRWIDHHSPILLPDERWAWLVGGVA